MKRTVLAALGRPRHEDLGLLLLDLHARRDDLHQLAERPADLNRPGEIATFTPAEPRSVCVRFATSLPDEGDDLRRRRARRPGGW